jgi:hypothetical protein
MRILDLRSAIRSFEKNVAKPSVDHTYRAASTQIRMNDDPRRPIRQVDGNSNFNKISDLRKTRREQRNACSGGGDRRNRVLAPRAKATKLSSS